MRKASETYGRNGRNAQTVSMLKNMGLTTMALQWRGMRNRKRYWVETRARRGRVSKEQQLRIEMNRKAGGRRRFIDTKGGKDVDMALSIYDGTSSYLDRSKAEYEPSQRLATLLCAL